MMGYTENLQKCHEYVKALEEERRKIEMFQRELPLCLEIVTQAIETCKQQLSGTAATTTTTECLNGQSECSEQTTSDGPVFEEFIPIKKITGGGEEEEEEEELHSQRNSANFNDKNDRSGSGKKSDWLSSAQLWNQSPDPPTTTTKEVHQSNQPRRVSVVEVKRSSEVGVSENTMDFTAPAPAPAQDPAASACSTAERSAGGGGRAGKEGGQAQARKARRCWSPELHRRFLNALEQLGGSHVATPKQIRELIKVDGLTNDEVKSHLQKYRLHTRRPTPAASNNTTTQPHFVLVGGIWMPLPDYAATGAPPAGVYAPAAAPPAPQAANPAQRQRHQHKQSSSHSEGGVARCNSPATSSSTHTVAHPVVASPSY